MGLTSYVLTRIRRPLGLGFKVIMQSSHARTARTHMHTHTNTHSPAPRSAHQAVIHKGSMYVFGGEFTSPNQERFHHYKVGCGPGSGFRDRVEGRGEGSGFRVRGDGEGK